MSIKQLQELQDIFIQAEDWEEVSKIQYEIDCLPPSEQRQQFEVWFMIALDQFCLKLYDGYLSKVIELAELYKKENKMTDDRDVSPDWDNDKWGEEDWADFLGCDVEQLEDTMENQMD